MFVIRLFGLILLFFVIGAGPVMAQKTPDEGTGDIREYISKKWPQFFSATRRMKALPVYPTMIPGDRKTRMKQVISAMGTEYDKKLLHYDTLLGKIESRRDKLDSEGKDTTNIDAKIEKARQHHESLSENFSQKKKVLSALDSSETPENVKKKLGPQLSALRSSFKELHGEVDDLVRELKLASGFTVTPRPTKLLLPTGYRQYKQMMDVPPPRYKQGAN